MRRYGRSATFIFMPVHARGEACESADGSLKRWTLKRRERRAPIVEGPPLPGREHFRTPSV